MTSTAYDDQFAPDPNKMTYPEHIRQEAADRANAHTYGNAPMTDELQPFYIDCEFDGHNGPLLSMALVSDRSSIHIATTAEAKDPWVLENVVPLIDSHDCSMAVRCLPNEVGAVIRTFIDCDRPTIIADSPVDIGRFCHALSTGPDGGWASAEYPRMTFEVHNVDCYPTELEGAVQHNAWWDAMALRATLAQRETRNDR